MRVCQPPAETIDMDNIEPTTAMSKVATSGCCYSPPRRMSFVEDTKIHQLHQSVTDTNEAPTDYQQRPHKDEQRLDDINRNDVNGGVVDDDVDRESIDRLIDGGQDRGKLTAAEENEVVDRVRCSEPIQQADADEDTRSSAEVAVRDDTTGCVHYKRKAKFVTPCCGKFYKCRYCHDENEEHHFDRKTLTELICTQCDTRQKVQADCENCGVRFGQYTCLICNLFDDEDKDQYHCHGCGICRLGGRLNFFHCEVCNMCLPIQLRTDGHKCVENISRSNCPVCLGDIHTSRIPCHIPDCGHLLHKTCFDQLLASGHYVCPTCQTSMIDMKKLWDYLDAQALHIPVPKSYQKSNVNIFCNDCFKQSTVKFHFVGLKCGNCGGYNTSQNMQKRSWNNSKDNPSTSA